LFAQEVILQVLIERFFSGPEWGAEDKAGSEDGLVIVAAQMVLMNSREAVSECGEGSFEGRIE
jgi:hypothetical protein